MKKRAKAAALLLAMLTAVCLQSAAAAEEDSQNAAQTEADSEAELSDQVASKDEMIEQEEVVTDEMTPIYADQLEEGTYSIEVLSSSSMFRVIDCQLTVADGEMTAELTLSSDGYLKLFMGTGAEAAASSEEEYISFTLDDDGKQVYTVPVEGLDMAIDCAAYSRRKEKWYDRTLVFSSATLPQEALPAASVVTAETLSLEDGTYTVEVSLEGGSGRASVESPTGLVIADGEATATITFSSSNYDYVLVDDEKYEPVNTEGNSTFEIPVSSFDWKMPVTADTVAMSTPHEIDYTLYFDSATITEAAAAESAENAVAEEETVEEMSAEDSDLPQIGDTWCGLNWESAMELKYARQFQVNYYEGGYVRIDIAGGECFLLIPEEGEIPEKLEEGVTVLQMPVQNIYLVATSCMDFFSSLDAMDAIRLSGTEADGWYVEKAREAMEDGTILYAGKYSAPDYELILSEGCGLAVESTMIYHNPEVKEKLEGFGIPVLVERSSYESHPMGRSEWIRLYGALLGLEEQAEEIFDAQVEQVKAVEAEEDTGKTVAFFYINSNGSANVRKADDYIAKMIQLAGGEYIFDDLEDDTSLSTVNMTMEEFYAGARDADYIIYNSTIDGEIYSVDELLSKSALLADFRAVQEGNVWCTGKNLFQETTSLGGMIVDIHTILSDPETEDSELSFLHRVE